jgi:biofilm protein TabA
MIVDRIENISFYVEDSSDLYRALDFAVNFDLSNPDGVYEVEGRNMFAKVASYSTSSPEKCLFEAHHNYFDIQVIRSGEERIDISFEKNLKPVRPYDPEDDVVKLENPTQFSTIVLKPGMFAVFYPQDTHRPNCTANLPTFNRKVCMKVRIDSESTRMQQT